MSNPNTTPTNSSKNTIQIMYSLRNFNISEELDHFSRNKHKQQEDKSLSLSMRFWFNFNNATIPCSLSFTMGSVTKEKWKY